MFQNINKNKKSFIVAITMAIVLLFASALSSLIQTSIGPIAPPTQAGSWVDYAVKPAGTGYKSNPYQITSAGELAWLINNLSLRADNSATGDSGLEIHIDLLSDIDLADHEWSPIQAAPTYGITVTSTTYQGFLFFNGNNHTIYNMHMNKPNGNKVGLFAGKTKFNGHNVIQDMTIRDLTMANVDVIGYAEVGAVVGYCDYSNGLDNVHVTSGSVLGVVRVGGLVGNSTCFINNCTNAATVKASEGTVGGLVGDHASRSITNSVNMGTVSSLNGYNIGGIAGSLGSWNYDGVMDNCLAECDIYGMRNIGGLVGSFSGNSITNSGFRGEIHLTATTNTKSIGSMCGSNGYRASRSKFIENCFGLADIYADYNASNYVLPYGVSTIEPLKDCYSYTKVHSLSGLSEYRTRRDGENNFNGMVYHKNINGGYPFPRTLFAVGQFIECDTLSYLEEYCFVIIPEVSNDTYYDYIMLGKYPQTFVGKAMNETLENWYNGQTAVGNYQKYAFNNDSNASYKYIDGSTYVRVAVPMFRNFTYTFEDGTAVSDYVNKAVWFKVEPIKWWIWRAGKNLELVPEKALMAMAFQAFNNGENVNQTLPWLNNKFYNDAFSKADKSFILLGDGTNYVTSWRGGGPFVPTYFAPTDYTLAHNCEMLTGSSYATIDRPNGGRCAWFTGDTFVSGYGDGQNYATHVAAAGGWNNVIASAIEGVRPYLEIVNVKKM